MGEAVDTSQVMQIADGLVIKWVRTVDLKEQDLNAQIMEPRKFDTLTQNVKLRGMLESLPYCYQPDGKGSIQIVSGHHRVRSANKAGIKEIPVIVDEKHMSRSTITAKQIAANELTGTADEKLLAQLIQNMDSVDDMLMSGLDENQLPHPEPAKVDIDSLNLKYDFKSVEFLFLSREFDEVKEYLEKSGSDFKAVAEISVYEDFSRELVLYANRHNIKNISSALSDLIGIARKDRVESEEASK